MLVLGEETRLRWFYLSLSSLRWSMFSSLRRSFRTFFFFSLSVCLFVPGCVCWEALINQPFMHPESCLFISERFYYYYYYYHYLVSSKTQICQNHLLPCIIVCFLFCFFFLFSCLLILVDVKMH